MPLALVIHDDSHKFLVCVNAHPDYTVAVTHGIVQDGADNALDTTRMVANHRVVSVDQLAVDARLLPDTMQ